MSSDKTKKDDEKKAKDIMRPLFKKETTIYVTGRYLCPGDYFLTPKKIPVDKDVEVNCVSCGQDFILIMSTDGRIYGCGDNQYGQLGLGHNIRVRDCTQITTQDNKLFSQVSAGSYHSALLSNQGELYMMGCGTYGRLGLGDSEHRNIPTKLEINIKGYDPKKIIVQQVSCGDQHTIICLKETGMQVFNTGNNSNKGNSGDSDAIMQPGDVLVWGNGRQGRLGLGNEEDVFTPTLLKFFSKHTIGNREIEKTSIIHLVSAGFSHSACVDTQGRVYTWGDGGDGRLGHGNENSKWEPALVHGLGNSIVTSISCGMRHTLCVDNIGTCYSWGRGQYGRLGIGNSKDYSIPQIVPGFNNKSLSVSAGFKHSMLLSTDGQMYVFGDGTKGRLGLGDQITQLRPVVLPNILDGEVKGNITAYCAGYDVSVVAVMFRIPIDIKTLTKEEDKKTPEEEELDAILLQDNRSKSTSPALLEAITAAATTSPKDLVEKETTEKENPNIVIHLSKLSKYKEEQESPDKDNENDNQGFSILSLSNQEGGGEKVDYANLPWVCEKCGWTNDFLLSTCSQCLEKNPKPIYRDDDLENWPCKEKPYYLTLRAYNPSFPPVPEPKKVPPLVKLMKGQRKLSPEEEARRYIWMNNVLYDQNRWMETHRIDDTAFQTTLPLDERFRQRPPDCNVAYYNPKQKTIEKTIEELGKYRTPTDHVSPRFKEVPNNNPGPGSYPGIRPKFSHIKYTIGKSQAPFRAPLVKNNDPSPVTYHPEKADRIYKPVLPTFSVPKEGIEEKPAPEVTPGPGHYSPIVSPRNPVYPSIHPRGDTALDQAVKSRKWVPGPNSYKISDYSKKTAPSYSIGHENDNLDSFFIDYDNTFSTPGPSSYENPSDFGKVNAGISFDRSPKLPDPLLNGVPPVTYYHPQPEIIEPQPPKFSFGKGHGRTRWEHVI